MIQLPRRSVTRFFIPLIDVFTLLFCIFLLMPLVKATNEPETPVAQEENAVALSEDRTLDPAHVLKLKESVEAAERELQRLRAEQIETLQNRLAIRVLEIDPDTGRLYYFEPEQRLEIGSQAEARETIDRHRREAPGREIYYLFLFPRRLTGFPQQKQVQQYERWFEGVAHGLDNPRGGR